MTKIGHQSVTVHDAQLRWVHAFLRWKKALADLQIRFEARSSLEVKMLLRISKRGQIRPRLEEELVAKGMRSAFVAPLAVGGFALMALGAYAQKASETLFVVMNAASRNEVIAFMHSPDEHFRDGDGDENLSVAGIRQGSAITTYLH